jgi:hypothetical protein
VGWVIAAGEEDVGIRLNAADTVMNYQNSVRQGWFWLLLVW